jgi:hypothetical protein
MEITSEDRERLESERSRRKDEVLGAVIVALLALGGVLGLMLIISRFTPAS